jgi:L-amino acid N-acyltransferase YncA
MGIDFDRIVFRTAVEADVEAINKIYNQAIKKGHQTADLEELLIEQTREWLGQHAVDDYPVFVVEYDGKVIGWSSVSPYRNGRQALRKSAEISYYLDHSQLGKGIGSFLLRETINEARKRKYSILVAILLDTNMASKGILTKFGFEEWGRIKRAALVDDREVDHLYFGLSLK